MGFKYSMTSIGLGIHIIYKSYLIVYHYNDVGGFYLPLQRVVKSQCSSIKDSIVIPPAQKQLFLCPILGSPTGFESAVYRSKHRHIDIHFISLYITVSSHSQKEVPKEHIRHS